MNGFSPYDTDSKVLIDIRSLLYILVKMGGPSDEDIAGWLGHDPAPSTNEEGERDG